MIRLELCKLGYKIRKKLLPKPILDIFHLNGGAKKHRYPTHNKATPNIQKHTSTNFNNSLLCGSLQDFMKLTGITKDSRSLTALW